MKKTVLKQDKKLTELSEMLNLKQSYTFDTIPYGMTEYKPVTLHNDSEEMLDLHFNSDNAFFSVNPQSMQLMAQSTQTINICCTPKKVGTCAAVLQLFVAQQLLQEMQVSCECIELSVEIQPSTIEKFNKALVTQTEKCTTTILNTSDTPFRFWVRKFPMPVQNEDPLYSDDQFTIATLQGRIFPQATFVVQASFTPKQAGQQDSTAWLDTEGRYQRIPILLKATAIAPEVDFDYDVLQFTEVTIGASSKQSFALVNYSDIQIEFQLNKVLSSQNYPLLHFSQETGVVPPKSQIELKLIVTPRQLGETVQKAEFRVIGCIQPLTLEITTNTIAPKIDLKTSIDSIEIEIGNERPEEVLDFEVVPYGFSQSKEVHLFNHSDVSQEFALKVEPGIDAIGRQNQLLIANDFNISPAFVKLEKGEHRSISVTLLPKHNSSSSCYRDFFLNIYNRCQEQPLAYCRVQANVINAKFALSPSVVDLQRSYVGFSHKIVLEIQNVSKVVGRWLFPNQNLTDQCIISADVQSGVIAPNKVQQVICTLIPRTPGNIVMPITFYSDVGDQQELICMVQYNARGPSLQLNSDTVRFANCKVLEQNTKTIQLTCNSESSCRIRIASQKSGSYFTIQEKYQNVIIQNGETFEVKVDFMANVQGNHQDTLLLYCELANQACDVSEEVLREISTVYKIKVCGEAKGSSLICPHQDFNIDQNVDCGQFFTTELLEKTIRIENHGPEDQTLTWSYVNQKNNQQEPLISCVNNKQLLKSGQFCEFVFQARSSRAIDFRSESWMLRSNVAGKSTDTAFTINLQYKFITTQVAITKFVTNPKTETTLEEPVDVSKKCNPITLSFEEFPVFGDLETYFGEDMYKQKYICQLGDDSNVYRNVQISQKIKIKNLTQLGCRIQAIIKAPLYLKIVDKDGNEVQQSAEQEQQIQNEEFKMSQLTQDQPYQYQSSTKQFESFILQNINDEQYLEIGVQEQFCEKDRISKNVEGALHLRLLPYQQDPTNVPTIKIPITVQILYPSCVFRSCDQATFLENENQPYQNFFEKLSDLSSIDFGSTVPGTPINRFIFVKNVSLYPLQMKWEISNFKLENCQFDINPSGIVGDTGLLHDQIALFKCKFSCDAGEKPSMRIQEVGVDCEIVGGPVHEYCISAQISNLAVDVLPSHINLSEIAFNGEVQQSIYINNQSDVQTVLQLKVPKESVAFIKKIDDKMIVNGDPNAWDFTLAGNQKREIKITFAPRVPGQFYLPLYVKIGHLEEIKIPVTGTSYVENLQCMYNDQIIKHHESFIPWKQSEVFVPYSSLLKAAYTLDQKYRPAPMTPSTLNKIVDLDGSLTINGVKYEVCEDINIDLLQNNAKITQLADELLLTNIELYKYQNVEKTSRVVSRARSRQEQAKMFTYINENPFQVIRTESELPRYPTLFHLSCEFPPCQKQTMATQQIQITNMGTTNLTIAFEKRFYFPFGINVEPERIARLPAGESTTITVTFTPAQNSPIGDVKFLIPFIFKTGAYGFLTVNAKVAVPTIKPANLMQLASNFADIPVKQQENSVMHFGKCFFGRAVRFCLQLQNPTLLPAGFSCDVSGGATVQYQLDSHTEVNLKEKISSKLDNVFTISSTNAVIEPNGETFLAITFTPQNCMQAQYGQGTVFCGELKFAIKTGVDSISRLVISLVGIGYHPQVKVDLEKLNLPPVFPREISQNLAKLQIINDQDQPLEFYIPEYDEIHVVENILLNIIAQLDGQKNVKKVKNETITKVSFLFNEFADAGSIFSEKILTRLQDMGLKPLTDYLIQKYQQFNGQNEIVKQFIEQLVKQQEEQVKDPKRPKSGQRGDKQVKQDDLEKTEIIPQIELKSAKSTISLVMEKRNQLKMKELDELIDNDNFSYNLTADEQTIIKYGKQCSTVKNNRSYRIASEDQLFSNLPFLTYLVIGSPLSGKSTLAKKIQKCFNIKNKTIPIINIDQIIGASKVAEKYQKLQEEQQNQKDVKKQVKTKDAPPVVDLNAYKKVPEYLNELAEEFVTNMQKFYEYNDQYLKIGLIIDSLECQFVSDFSDLSILFKHFAETFTKPTLFDKQIFSSRIALYPIILDIEPVVARKRAIEAIVAEYREAESELRNAKDSEQKESAESRMRLAKTTMVDAKQYYDVELQNQNLQQEVKFDIITLNYNKIYSNSDVLGIAQQIFIDTLQNVETLLKTVKQDIYTLHKEIIEKNMQDTEKCQEQLQYDLLTKQCADLKNDIQNPKNKTQIKQLQLKLDDTMKQLQEAQSKLPQNPVDQLPPHNLYQLVDIKTTDCNVCTDQNIFNNIFNQIINRFIGVFKIYQDVLTANMSQTSKPNYSKLCALEELQLISVTNPQTIEQIKQILEQNDENHDLIQTLQNQKSLNYIINDIYQKINNAEEFFQIIPANTEYIEFALQQKAKINSLKQETDAMAINLKTLKKEQQVEYQAKLKEIQQLEVQFGTILSQQTKEIEGGFARWIVPAKSVTNVYFRVVSNKIQRHEVNLQIMSKSTQLTLPVTITAECDWPHIIQDFVQVLPTQSLKSFDKRSNTFDFKCVRSGVPVPELFTRELIETDLITNKQNYLEMNNILQQKASIFAMQHFKALLIENDSSFITNVAFVLESALNGEQPQTLLEKMYGSEPEIKDVKKEKAQAAKDKKGVVEQKQNCFAIYPQKLTLNPKEKQYVFLTAFPEQNQKFENKLYIGVQNNPQVLNLSLKAQGVTPAAKYVIPDCVPDLLPCNKQMNEVQEIINKFLGLNVDPKAKAKPAAPAPKKGEPIAPVVNLNMVQIPRISLKNAQCVEIPVTNNSDVQLYATYQPIIKDANIPDAFSKQFNLNDASMQFKLTEILPRKNDKDQTIIYNMNNKYLQINNYKFVLAPQETKIISIQFSSKDLVHICIPGRLNIVQFNKKQNIQQCSIPSLDNFSQIYRTPVVNNPFFIIGEAHNVNIALGVTNVLQSVDKVHSQQITYSIDNPTTNINFGTCKALTHFQAEAQVINNGQYDVQFQCDILDKYKEQFKFVVDLPKDPKAKKDDPAPVQQLSNLDFILQPPTPVDPKDKKAAVLEKLNQKLIKIDFYAVGISELNNTVIANVIFSDPVTKKLLMKTQLTVSVKVKYSQISASPDRILQFGDYAHGKEVTKIITIENIGPFTTNFVIEKLSTVVKRKIITGQCSALTQDYTAALQQLKIPQDKLTQLGYITDIGQPQQAAKPGAKPAGKTDPKAQQQYQGTLQIGPYTISPVNFSIQPNQKQQITISFNARGSAEFRDYVVFDYSNRLAKHADGAVIPEKVIEEIQESIAQEYATNKELAEKYPTTKQNFDVNDWPLIRYCLSAQSQIPGISINAQDLFEEQLIINQAVVDPISVTEGAQYSLLANQFCMGSCQLSGKLTERIRLFNPHNVETWVAIFLSNKVENVTNEQLITENIGDSLTRVMQFWEQNGGKQLTGQAATITTTKNTEAKKPAATTGAGKKDQQLDIVSNDDESWSIDKQLIRVLPHESQYITVNYKPSKQVISKQRLIVTSIDNWMRLNEIPPQQGKVDPNLEKTNYLNLIKAYSQQDLKNSIVDIKLLGVGVLPEIVVSPKIINLPDVIVNARDEIIGQDIIIKNVGRVPSQISIQIKCQQQSHSDLLQLCKSSNSTVEPDNRLFTGLKTVLAGESVAFYVQPYLNQLQTTETINIEAVLAVKIMTSGDSFQGLEIPIKLNIIASAICIQQDLANRDKLREKHFQDVIQCLFSIPETANVASLAQQIKNMLSESSAFTQQRQQFIQILNVLQEKPEYRQNLFVNDCVQQVEDDWTTFKLINQSVNTQRFEFDKQICQKLGIEINPTVGHINSCNSQEIRIKLIMPITEVDTKAKKQPTTTNRSVLFGNPLLVKFTPIQLKKFKNQSWNNSQTQVNYITNHETNVAERKLELVPEPQFDVIPNEANIAKLQKEYDELVQMVQKKTKLTPVQQQRQQQLSKIVENSYSTENGILTASAFVEINLFGTFHQQSLKVYYKNDNGQLTQLSQQLQNNVQTIDLPFSEIPILQKSDLTLFAVNDGISAPNTLFLSNQSESAVAMDCPKTFLPKPDQYAVAIKEHYSNICDIASVTQLLTKNNINAKAADKNFLTSLAAKFNNVETNPYAQQVKLSYEPKIPGVYEEIFTSTCSNLELHIHSSASLPLCHMECPPSKYLQTQRPASYATPYSFANLLSSNTKAVKVIQINSIGVGVKAMQDLKLLNTISQSYEIQLQRLTESTQKIICNLQNYTITPGENLHIKFEYVPDKASAQRLAEEAFYILKIPAHDVKIPLLIVGMSQEPNVSISTTKLNFGSVPHRGVSQMEVQLKNNENVPFSYNITMPHCNQFEVKVTPTQGMIPAQGTTTLQLSCHPQLEGRISEVVQIDIARKSMPLQLNIKYQCFKAKYELLLLPETETGQTVPVTSNIDMNFGQVFVADLKQRQFKVTNVGTTPIKFAQLLKLDRTVSTARRDQMELAQIKENIDIKIEGLDIQKDFYQLQPNESCLLNITFAPKETLIVDKKYGLYMDIFFQGVNHQRVNIIASSVRPGLASSANELDFGTVLADLISERCLVKTISFTNLDRLPLQVEFLTESEEFCIITPPQVEPLKPGQKLDIEIKFQPVFAQRFQSQLNVTVNGLYKLKYNLFGLAVPHDIVVDQSILQMGSRIVRSEGVFKQTILRNKSNAPTFVELQIDPEYDNINGLFVTVCQLDNQQQFTTKLLEQCASWDQRQQKKRFLQQLPKQVLIPAKSGVSIISIYAPVERSHYFKIPINIQVEKCHQLKAAFQIEGCGQGASIKLLAQQIDMPSCLEGSFVTMHIPLENSGDIPVTYITQVPPKNVVKRSILQMFEKQILTISPATGTVQPGQTAQIAVRFQPPVGFQQQTIEIPNISIDYEHLGERLNIGFVNILVKCESPQKFNVIATNPISFTCPSRDTDVKTTRIENSTGQQFEVRTVLQGDSCRHFTVPDRLVVPPGGLEFQIQYKPMVQTGDKQHLAKLIVASPQGGAVIYELTGIATLPILDGLILNVNANQIQVQQQQQTQDKTKPGSAKKKPVDKKTKQEEPAPTPAAATTLKASQLIAYKPMKLSVPVRNWETMMQRFVVSHQLNNQEQNDLCRITYPGFVDVAPNGQIRDVEIQIIAFALTQFQGFIQFTNEVTKECIKYQFVLECNKIEPLQMHLLETTVRDPIQKQIAVPNIVAADCFIQPSCPRQDIQFQEQKTKLSSKQISMGSRITFKPLVPYKNIDQIIEYNVTLITDNNKEIKLAPIQVMLTLTANAPRPSSPLRVQADLGKTLQFQIALKNETKDKLGFNSATTEISDILEICQLLQNASAAPAKGSKETTIADGKKLLQQCNGIAIVNQEVQCDGGSNFVMNLTFSPKQIGEFIANVVVYSKTGGVWVVPVVGRCMKPPAAGSIVFE